MPPAATILPPPQIATAAPRPVRWTCTEFHRVGDLGVFEGRRAMLIDGVISEQGPVTPLHAGPRDYPTHPTTADLVIEISDTSFDFDTTDKRLLYARAGIRDYWVVDVNSRRLLVYRNPRTGDYAAPQVIDIAGSVSPLAMPAAVVRVADLMA